jgi:hypothetical protein
MDGAVVGAPFRSLTRLTRGARKLSAASAHARARLGGPVVDALLDPREIQLRRLQLGVGSYYSHATCTKNLDCKPTRRVFASIRAMRS